MILDIGVPDPCTRVSKNLQTTLGKLLVWMSFFIHPSLNLPPCERIPRESHCRHLVHFKKNLVKCSWARYLIFLILSLLVHQVVLIILTHGFVRWNEILSKICRRVLGILTTLLLVISLFLLWVNFLCALSTWEKYHTQSELSNQ